MSKHMSKEMSGLMEMQKVYSKPKANRLVSLTCVVVCLCVVGAHIRSGNWRNQLQHVHTLTEMSRSNAIELSNLTAIIQGAWWGRLGMSSMCVYIFLFIYFFFVCVCVSVAILAATVVLHSPCSVCVLQYRLCWTKFARLVRDGGILIASEHWEVLQIVTDDAGRQCSGLQEAAMALRGRVTSALLTQRPPWRGIFPCSLCESSCKDCLQTLLPHGGPEAGLFPEFRRAAAAATTARTMLSSPASQISASTGLWGTTPRASNTTTWADRWSTKPPGPNWALATKIFLGCEIERRVHIEIRGYGAKDHLESFARVATEDQTNKTRGCTTR